MKKTWKDNTSIINLKSTSSNFPRTLSNNNIIMDPYEVVNTFNNYFASIGEMTNGNIKYTYKHFSDYLKN